MRNRFRHKRRQEPVELNITAFMNLMVILVPFLLITAVFSRLTILELTVPEPSTQPVTPPEEKIKFAVTVRTDALELADTKGGLIKRIAVEDSSYNYHLLSETLAQLKARMPDKTDITLLLEPETSYDIIIQVMDAVKVLKSPDGANMELFPDISIGDATAKPTSEGS